MRTSRIVKSMSSTSSHWMRNSYGFYRNGSRWSTVLWYGKCAYSQRNDINTEQLFFVSLKTAETERKKEIKKSTHTRSRSRYTWLVNVLSTTELCQHHAHDAEKNKHPYSSFINYETAGTSPGSRRSSLLVLHRDSSQATHNTGKPKKQDVLFKKLDFEEIGVKQRSNWRIH